MRLLRWHAENFLSFKEFDVSFVDKGLCLILGENADIEHGSSNGSGKSTIADSVTWCLFDQTCRGISGDDVICVKVGKDCIVSGTVEVAGVTYTISRYRKHSVHGNALRLLCGDKDLSGATIRDTQDKVEQLLGMSYKTFVSGCMFGQNMLDVFSRATDKERKQILESVVETKDYSEALQRVRDVIKLVKGRVAAWEQDKAVTVSVLDSKRTMEQRLVRDKNDAVARAETEKARIAKELQDTHIGDRDAALAEIAAAKDSISKLSVGIDNSKEIADLRRQVEELTAEQVSLRTAMSSAKRKIEDVDHRLKHINGLGSACPTCEQSIPDSHKEKISSLLQETAREEQKVMSDFEEKVLAIGPAITNNRSRIAELQAQEDDARKKMYTAKNVLLSAENALGVIDRAIKQKQLLESRLASVKVDTESFEQALSSLQKEIPELESKLPVLEDNISSAQALLPYLEYWEVGFGDTGIRSFLFDSCMPVLNKMVNHYLKELTSGSVQAEFASQSMLRSGKLRDKIGFSVVNYCGSENYAGNSGGEKRRIDVAVMLALNFLMRHSSKSTCNILFFDEVFDNLDAEGCVKVLEILASELGQHALESIFVISHNDALKSLFLNKITVSKRGGISWLTEN